MISGQKHLIKCRCVLQQYKRLQNPPVHHFVVFSVVKDDNVVSKYCQCNNCGIIHKVVDICKSEIQAGKENMNSIIKIEDIKPSLHANFCNLLEANNCDVATWEAVQFIVENKDWGSFVVLTTDSSGDELYGKYMRILGETLCKVESFSRNNGVI